MGFFPDIFVDEDLKRRQDQLNGVWLSLNTAKQGCNGMPDTAWLEFVNDFKSWQTFYEGGSNWSDDSRKATDNYQRQAQEWSAKITSYGCGAPLGEDPYGNPTGRSGGSSVIPGVKDPPPEEKDLGDKALDAIGTAGWVATALVVIILLGIFYILSRPTVHGAAARYAGGR